MVTTTTSEGVVIDWDSLGFEIVKTKSFIRYQYRDGKWDSGALLSDHSISLNVWATALHYGQNCFEGLKAFRMNDGKVRLFRPDLNAKRLIQSCEATSMVPPPEALFIEACIRVVKDNIEYVPPYGSSGSMYIRPLLIGTGPQVGLTPSDSYDFYVLVNPVGEYYKGGMGRPVKAFIQHGFDRAAPHGSGHVKLGGNYAPALGPTAFAKKKGYTVTLFLDAKEHTYVEEFATSNFAALTKPDTSGKRTYVTPKSKSVLPSVTNRSLTELAAKHFGWHVERRLVPWTEVRDGAFEEVAACGTAVIITPVGSIHREIVTSPGKTVDVKSHIDTLWDDSEETPDELDLEKVEFPDTSFEGFKALYVTYRQLQAGELKGWESYGWMVPAEGI